MLGKLFLNFVFPPFTQFFKNIYLIVNLKSPCFLLEFFYKDLIPGSEIRNKIQKDVEYGSNRDPNPKHCFSSQLVRSIRLEIS